MGANCNLSQGVTLGGKDTGQYKGVPRIGDRVYIGPNAIIIGGIEIGDDVAVGAGSVVTKSLPPRSVAAGNPARIISGKGSFESVIYAGMESDPARQASLKLSETEAITPDPD
jgi:serine O-acetyltransferase